MVFYFLKKATTESRLKKPKNHMLSDDALQSFKKIWKEQYGEEISDEKAEELGLNLLTIFDHIYRPIKKNCAELSEENKIQTTNQQKHETSTNQQEP